MAENKFLRAIVLVEEKKNDIKTRWTTDQVILMNGWWKVFFF
jgi:hypothetical protein